MVVLKNGRLRLKFWCPSQVKTPRSGKCAEMRSLGLAGCLQLWGAWGGGGVILGEDSSKCGANTWAL